MPYYLFPCLFLKVSIRRISLVCAAISFVVCAIQAYLEIYEPFYGFQVGLAPPNWPLNFFLLQVKNGFDLYGQGGPAYLAVTSSLLVIEIFTLHLKYLLL